MSKIEKLINRIKSYPNDLTIDEMETLLFHLGFSLNNAGKTSGSRKRYESEKYGCIQIHSPHPGKILKKYQVKSIVDFLEEEKLI